MPPLGFNPYFPSMKFHNLSNSSQSESMAAFLAARLNKRKKYFMFVLRRYSNSIIFNRNHHPFICSRASQMNLRFLLTVFNGIGDLFLVLLVFFFFFSSFFSFW